MNLIIKNEKLISHFNEMQNNPMQDAYLKARTSKKPYACIDPAAAAWSAAHPENILHGYFSSFIEICEEHGIEIDLTYNTVNNLGTGLAALFKFQKKHYEIAKNIEITAKTLASLLSYIAVNEHDLWFRVTLYSNRANAARPLWGDSKIIAVGKKNKFTDFLPCCIEAVKAGTLMTASGMTLHIDSVVAEYNKSIGIDLTKYGFANLFIN